MHRFHLLLTFFIATGAVCKAQSIVVDSTKELIIDSNFRVLKDADKNLSFDNAVKLYNEGRFTKPVADSFKQGYDVYWLSFSLTNNTSVDGEWILDFQNWSDVIAYVQNGDHYDSKHSGHLYPYRKRDYPVANMAYILVPIQSHQTLHCFVRLESRYNNQLIPTNLSFQVSSRYVIDKENSRIGAVLYAALAVLLVMFLYNLFIYFSTFLTGYAYYLIVIFFAMYNTSSNSGYLIEIFGKFDGFPVWLTWFETISSALFGISALLFVRELLRIKERYPVWDKIVRIAIWCCAVSWIPPLINADVGNLLSAICGIGTIAVIFILGVKSTIDKYPSSVYFLIGFSAFLLSILIVILAVIKVIPQNLWTFSYSLPLGTTVEILLFSFALANLINLLRKENAAKQKEIIAQLEENQQLQTKVNRELEFKVQERTQELNLEKERVMMQKVEIENEKEKSEKLLLNILPESTANELKTKGFATPRFYQEATVMFTDFVGFTNITETTHTEKLVEELDYCFKSFDEIISKHQIEKIKTIGDSYMAVCGVPEIDKDHAVKTVRAAKDIMNFIHQWNLKRHAGNEMLWQMRIGIHSGPVIAGVVGKVKFAFDVWGDTVNIASRMESSGDQRRINISETTFQLVKAEFPCTYRGKIPAKNKGEIAMYFVDEDDLEPAGQKSDIL